MPFIICIAIFSIHILYKYYFLDGDTNNKLIVFIEKVVWCVCKVEGTKKTFVQKKMQQNFIGWYKLH